MATKKNTTINGKEYYRLRRTIDGRVRAFYGTSKHDAERKYREYLERLAHEKYTQKELKDTVPFKQRADEYIENVLRVSQKYANSTKYRYEKSYRTYIEDSELKDLIFARVRPIDIQMFYNRIDVSSQTIKGINKFMSAFCKWGVLNNYCEDFMSAVEIPQKPDNKRHEEIIVWESDEIRRILSASEMRVEATSLPVRQAFMLRVMIYTGCRISEVLSLKYTDFENGILNVSRQFYMGEVKPPKYNSVRQIPMHEELKRTLPIHRKWHLKEMKENHYKSDYVFTTSTGNLYDPSNIRTALRRFYKAHGIPYKHPHAYRATFCTQLCRCGVPLEVASSLMGHKSMEVTAKHYALVKKDTKFDAIKKLTYEF